jgi:hypothetical protein
VAGQPAVEHHRRGGEGGRALSAARPPAGYSGTPLVRKLGFKPGFTAAFVGAPEGFDALLGELPDGVRVVRRLRGPLDLIVCFVTARRELERRLPALRAALQPAGMLWIAWPKRASGVPTDMTEDVVRAVALPTGLVDTKVAAIDETWSGLRLVVRKELR